MKTATISFNEKPIDFLDAKKILKDAYQRVSPTVFLEDMKMLGLVRMHNAKDNYHVAVELLCKNGATWLGGKLYNNHGYRVIMHRGLFNGEEHCWVEVDGYYLDLTLGQFDSRFPKFAAVRAAQHTGWPLFQPREVLPFAEWERKYKGNEREL